MNTSKPSSNSPQQNGIKTYWPLLLIAIYILLVSFFSNFSAAGIAWHGWMNDFMAGFFLVFSAFKFLDLAGFAEAYASYDLLAEKWRFYGYLYPFLELALGLAYLTHFSPRITYTATIVLMGFSSIGVIKALRLGRKFQCACLGTILKLPMSSITLIEDLLMVAMALIMLMLL